MGTDLLVIGNLLQFGVTSPWGDLIIFMRERLDAIFNEFLAEHSHYRYSYNVMTMQGGSALLDAVVKLLSIQDEVAPVLPADTMNRLMQISGHKSSPQLLRQIMVDVFANTEPATR